MDRALAGIALGGSARSRIAELLLCVSMFAVARAAQAQYCIQPAPQRSPWGMPRGPESSTVFTCGEISLSFSRTFTGTYRNGQPYDVVTLRPDGRGETLEETGITLRVRLYCGAGGCENGGAPLDSVPAEEIILFNSQLCHCEGMHAARPSDANGETEFTGTFRAGGCVPYLALFVNGEWVATIPIQINSPDAPGTSPCAVDASDVSALAERLGRADRYSICFDYNESGGINAGDLSFFAAALGARCP